MNISTLFTVCLIFLMIINIYRKFIIIEHRFLETNCIEGHLEGNNKENIVECVACDSFVLPIKSESTGYYVIDNMPMNPAMKPRTEESKLMIAVWMQEGCTDYQCPTLLSTPTQEQNSVFEQSQGLKSSQFKLPFQNRHKIQVVTDYWKTQKIPYTNQIKDSNNKSAVLLFFTKLLHKLIEPLKFNSRQNYYSSMAIKFRYLISNDQSLTHSHPLVRIYQTSQSYLSYLLFSVLAGFVLFYKFSEFRGQSLNSRLPFFQIAICLGFILPEIVSGMSLISLGYGRGKWKIWHFISLLVYLLYVGTGYSILAIIAAKISLIVEYQSSKMQEIQENQSIKTHSLTFAHIAIFITIIIFNHLVFQSPSLFSMAPNLIYALAFQPSSPENHSYQPVKKQKQIIQIEEIQELE